MKVGEAVSTIMNRFRALTQDKRLSRRYVQKEILTASKFLFEQKVNGAQFPLDFSYRNVTCVEMIPIQSIECPLVEIRSCRTIMRTKDRLPEVVFSRFGPLIREVTTIDNEKVFKRVTKQGYRNLKNKPRSKMDPKLYYLYDDGYLYILDTEIYSINFQMITFDNEGYVRLTTCQGENCQSAWDFEIQIPDDLLKTAIDLATQAISVNRQIPIDEKPDLNERE